MKKTITKAITKAEYLELLGMLSLASYHAGITNRLQRQILDLVGSKNGMDAAGEIAMAIFGASTVERLLENLGIAVEGDGEALQ